MHKSAANRTTAHGLSAWYAHPNAILYAATVVCGLGLLACNPNYRWLAQSDEPFGADFLQEWVAGDMLLNGDGARLYEVSEFAERQHAVERVGFQWTGEGYYPAVYPPPYFAAVAPLAILPYHYATYVWFMSLGIAFALSASWSIAQSRKEYQDATHSYGRVLAFWVIALLLPALTTGWAMGQKGNVWLLLLVVTWQLWMRDRAWLAGCVWGLVSLKPTLFLWLPIWMLCYRQWQFCLGTAVSASLIWGLSALCVPGEMWEGFLRVALHSDSYQSHGGYRTGWSTSLVSLFSWFGLSHTLSVIATVILAATTCLLIALRANREFTVDPDSVHDKLRDPSFLLAVLICTAILSPHAYFYDLVWLLLPLASLIQTRTRQGLYCLATIWLSMIVAQSYEEGFPILVVALLATWFLSRPQRTHL